MREGPSSGYLHRLDGALRAGCRALPRTFVRRHVAYVRRCQNADGGFRGPEGGSDLYYTEFALRALNLCDAPDDAGTWRGAAGYLRRNSRALGNVVNCFCALHAAEMVRAQGHEADPDPAGGELVRRCRSVLDGARTAGGYAFAEDGSASVYCTFLGSLCHELLGWGMPGVDAAVRGVVLRQGDDGGFRDCATDSPAPAGVNPTAAAVGLLSMTGRLEGTVAAPAVEFLIEMQAEDGGFLAHAGAAGSDLMSTFTALVTLRTLGALREARLADVGRYAGSLVGPQGGFRGAPGYSDADVEYTFYGLGTLSVLALEAAAHRSTCCSCREECTGT